MFVSYISVWNVCEEAISLRKQLSFVQQAGDNQLVSCLESQGDIL
jgi:hypothetical protein